MISRKITGILSASAMLILIFDSKTAISSASEAISICLNSVIPSLFPFFFLSGIICNSAFDLTPSLPKGVCNFFGISSDVEYLLIPAYLGGYPTGAHTVSQAHSSGKISKNNAQRMLAYCSNAGPAFIFGLAGQLFSTAGTAWMLWFIHVLSSLLTSSILSAGEASNSNSTGAKSTQVKHPLESASNAIISVCGWMLLFRVLIGYVNKYILYNTPEHLRILAMGLLELSNGCLALSSISDPNLRFILCEGMLCFGGLCVAAQTKSVTATLSLKYYYWGKFIQFLFGIGISILIITFGSWSIIIPVTLLLINKRIIRFSSGNSVEVRV